MGGAFSTYEREERVLVGNPEEKDHLEDPGVDWRIILRWIFRKWDGGMDCIDLAHYMYRTVVTICPANLTFSNSTFCPHSVFVWI
jgi:hypothetical protein